jgi:hypothetical protein
MNWDAIGAVGEIIGAVAVVVSLVYLASQLRQANEIARQSAYRDFQAAFDDTNSKANSDPELHKLWREALYERKPISDMERERIAFMLSRVFGAFNVAFHSSKRDPEFRDFVNQRLHVYLANPVVRGWWRRQRMQQPDPFRSIVDKCVHELDEAEGTDVEEST